ncbi:Por secretion system C-terminal sorting domain-containing protein [Aquimarina amphilecti]|uniref:Por secretion system C-terminal sorting domain-containing protein n=2 Tax=Aquimarina amphilecti TaxID=1038014 RepID=A0A1H7V7S9_AQUAM|nr:Por secretion system C-terminal sorting domain-containing protein [Aquimarina amphilecti]
MILMIQNAYIMNYKYVKNSFTFILLSLSSFLFAQENYVYQYDFDHLSSGQYNRDQIKEALNVSFCKGADEGRVHISDFENRGKVLDVKYPKGQVKTGESGMHTKVPFDVEGEYDELYISYWIYFPEDFEFRAGGKLPGLAYQTSERNMSLRLMWRYDGLVEFYVHYNTEPTWDGWHASINWSLTDPYEEPNGEPQADQVKFKKGQWNHVEMYNKLNTPGQNDGIMRGWLNGELAINITDNGDYRQVGEEDIHLNIIYLSTFFGGSDETFQPTKDLEAYFDDFIVSTTRIGDDSDNDGDGDNGGDTNQPPVVTFATPSNNITVDEGYSLDVRVNASDTDGSISNVKLYIDDTLVRQESVAPYEWGHPSSPNPNEVNNLSVGTHVFKAVATDNEGATSETTFTLIVKREDTDESDNCSFNTPVSNGISSINKTSFSEVYVLGDNVPVLENFRKITINWNAANNGLYQFAINTDNGVPSYYVDLKNKITHTLGQSSPGITINDSGIPGLDGSYWVTIDEDNFVMVSKTGGFTLYFSNTSQSPSCGNKSQPDLEEIDSFSYYPNPANNSILLNNVDTSVSEIVIYNMSSQKVKSIIPGKESTFSIDITSLMKGLYFIELRSWKKEIKRYKLIKN